MRFETSELIYDWNTSEGETACPPVELTDETLRDGLQSPSLIQPRIQDKVYLLYLMNDLGIQSVNVGIPATSAAVKYDCRVLAREVAHQQLAIRPQCAGRTLRQDVETIVEVSQWAGIEVEACLFIGSSPIRQYVEGWDLDTMLRLSEDSIRCAMDNGLPVTFSGYPCLAHFQFEHELANDLRTLYTQLMLARGFLAGTSIYATTAHTDEIIELYGEAIEAVFAEIAAALAAGDVSARLKGPAGHVGFRRLIS